MRRPYSLIGLAESRRLSGPYILEQERQDALIAPPAEPIIVNETTDFTSGIPSWLTSLASSPRTVSVISDQIELDSKTLESDYASGLQIMAYHPIPTGELFSGAIASGTFGTAGNGNYTKHMVGVFFEDEVSGSLIIYGGSRDISSSQYLEGQWEQKPTEAYNWFNDDYGVVNGNIAGIFVRIQYEGLDGTGNARFTTWTSVQQGTTKTVVGMGQPTRMGLVFRSRNLSLNATTGKVSFASASISYTVQP